MSGGTKTAVSQVPVPNGLARLRARARAAAVGLLIVLLAWAPFPLGGAIGWAAGLQEMLVALCWVLWVVSTLGSDESPSLLRVVAVPLVLAALALGWACLQILPVMPASWAHPVWAMASDVLGTPLDGVISLNPWRTEAEILKLASYVMACWLAFRLGRRPETARILLDAVIAIGAAYAVYAFVLAFIGTQQTAVFYSVPYRSSLLSGPFMLHNSFATYSGLATMAAVVKLFAQGSESIVARRGARQLALSTVQYCFGRGSIILVAALMCFAGVVASASRAGFLATSCGLVALALVALLMARYGASRLWAGAGALVAALPLLYLVVANGDTLSARLGGLLAEGTTDNVRLTLWSSASRMIHDAPWFGLGLGTFQDAYPLYAAKLSPFVMDKAHCDYLELAAGLGLPAAIAWWTALAWLFALCLRGVRVRRRNRAYCLVAIGASVLVGVHSAVDFSLQLPSVSLLYAVLMGLGVAQSTPTRDPN